VGLLIPLVAPAPASPGGGGTSPTTLWSLGEHGGRNLAEAGTSASRPGCLLLWSRHSKPRASHSATRRQRQLRRSSRARRRAHRMPANPAPRPTLVVSTPASLGRSSPLQGQTPTTQPRDPPNQPTNSPDPPVPQVGVPGVVHPVLVAPWRRSSWTLGRSPRPLSRGASPPLRPPAAALLFRCLARSTRSPCCGFANPLAAQICRRILGQTPLACGRSICTALRRRPPPRYQLCIQQHRLWGGTRGSCRHATSQLAGRAQPLRWLRALWGPNPSVLCSAASQPSQGTQPALYSSTS
jgi:hypothetical protein